jgi:hypothetical protein
VQTSADLSATQFALCHLKCGRGSVSRSVTGILFMTIKVEGHVHIETSLFV